ncbi:hypothetical protein [Piscinibacter sp.]|uniref:hypothetical protein n=1 Tax=Piscinibacter sp. TaxID=1903157 RepID=UPI00355A7E36
MSAAASSAAAPAPASIFVKTTLDGRRVEVVNGCVCLGGEPEAIELVPLSEHPNAQAILRAAPRATHMAGRLPLTAEEASVASDALLAALRTVDTSPTAIQQRLQRVSFLKAKLDGIE